MAKIVIDCRRLRESTGRYSREMLHELQQLDDKNEYHIVIHTEDQTHWQPKAKNFYLHIVPYDAYTFGEQIGFAKFLRKLNGDLVHFTMPQQPLLYFGKRITTIHDLTLVRFKNADRSLLIYNVKQAIFKFLLRNVARRSRIVITPSRFVQNDVARYAKIDPGKIVVTYEAAAPLTKLKPSAIKELKGKQFIFYVGNAFPHKNLGRLVEAFRQLGQRHPQLHLAFAGKKGFFYERLERESQGIKHIHFLDFITDEQLAWLYRNAKAYVFPSLSEGFGLPGIDVMQHGLPMASSNATCLPEVYGDAAHYFDPESVDDMARAIHQVLKNAQLRKQLVISGRRQLKKYSWKKLAIETRDSYERALLRR